MDEPRATTDSRDEPWATTDSQDKPRPGLMVYSVPSHETNTQMSFCLGTPKWEFRNSQSWDSCNFGDNNFVCRPPIEMRSKQSCNPH